MFWQALPGMHCRLGSRLRGALLLPVRCGEPSGSCVCEGPVDGGEEMLGTGKREGSSEAGKEEEMPEK